MSSKEKEINWKAVIDVIKCNKKFIGALTSFSTVIAIVYCIFATPIYTAKVLINPPKLTDSGTGFSQVISGITALTSGGSGLLQKTDADIAIAIMRTDSVSDMVIRQFNLIKMWNRTDFDVTRRVLSTIIRFVPDLRTGFVEIDVDNKNPQLAADIANYYTVALGQAINNVAYSRANQRYQFYESQLSVAFTALKDAENQLKLFTESNGILAGQQERVIASISSQLQGQLIAAQMQLQSMSYYTSSDNPDYRAMQTKIESIKKQINQLSNRSIDEDITIPVGLAPKLTSEYLSLTRNLMFKQLVYDVMLKQSKAAQLDAQSEMVPLAIQVIDPAQVPLYKSKPRRLSIIVKGLFLGLFFSFVYLIIRNRNKIFIVRSS
ncbi:MAG: hypothetical protein EKK57_05320 [Proteobacteria bacterium]|nr:MAG: hypothetical protein EKK57_05320 [Pseudomonadota bacterium]